MPVDYTHKDKRVLYQRDQYAKGGLGKRYWDFRDRVIFKYIPKDAALIVDAGCGEGITLEKLLPLYPGRVRGIDLNKENVEICKKFSLPVTQGDIFALQLPSDSVDCCILAEVIEHIKDYSGALIEIRRVLKKGGRLIIVFPNDFMFKCARYLAFRFTEARYDPGHLHQLAPRGMKKNLIAIDFDLVKVEKIPFFFWSISMHCVLVCQKP